MKQMTSISPTDPAIFNNCVLYKLFFPLPWSGGMTFIGGPVLTSIRRAGKSNTAIDDLGWRECVIELSRIRS